MHWGSVNSLQPWQFVPEKDPSHKLSDRHRCSGSASLGRQCLGSFSSSRWTELAPRAHLFGQTPHRPALQSGHQGSLPTAEGTMQSWPTCVLGATCAALQAPEKLHSGDRAEGVSSNDISPAFCVLQHTRQTACDHHSCGRRFLPQATASWAGQVPFARHGGGGKAQGEYQAKCHLFSTAAPLPCPGFEPLEWQTLTAGLLRTSSGLHGRSFMPLCFSKFLLASAKGVRVWHVSCPWVPSRERDPLGRCQKTAPTGAGEATPFHWVLWGGKRNQRVAPSQDTAPGCRCKNKACSCVQSGFLCGSRSLTDDEILFFNGFHRRKDQKISGMRWKLICLHFESALLLCFS